MERYRLQRQSDVLDRDGLGLELYDAGGALLAEVFRDDETGLRTFNSFGPLQLRPDVLAWFLDQAAQRL